MSSFLTDLSAYAADATQRAVLFLDLLRRRGNEELAITSWPMATVLRYEHEMIMSGRSLERPTNYMLTRILPPPGVTIEAHKRPVIVVDPRAGQGPGIGGFKADSEIGDALAEGHPAYFIGFGAEPVPGQQFLDVVEGKVKFVERVIELHTDALLSFVFGNCQAGYQTLMGAVLRPDLYGPCLVASSLMSYWQGEHGKYPMRYSGGLLGGRWATALASDLGHGLFDDKALIQNFDNLNPANSLWGKQYEAYNHVDTGAARYLEFEKWWGDFIQLGGDEIQFLVDILFIGDKLARNELQARDGTTFDLRNITSPIVVFTSIGDNISPPPQTLGWILDLYRDAEAIRTSGRTIVYCINQTVGHLALLVSSKVGSKEAEEFVQEMDIIVLGGTRLTAPTLLDSGSLDYLDALSEIEPSHQPYNVCGARAFADAFPGRPQVACFDTSFHRTMPAVAQTYALPQAVRDAGVRHWGFHGISYEYRRAPGGQCGGGAEGEACAQCARAA